MLQHILKLPAITWLYFSLETHRVRHQSFIKIKWNHTNASTANVFLLLRFTSMLWVIEYESHVFVLLKKRHQMVNETSRKSMIEFLGWTNQRQHFLDMYLPLPSNKFESSNNIFHPTMLQIEKAITSNIQTYQYILWIRSLFEVTRFFKKKILFLRCKHEHSEVYIQCF